MAEAVLKDVLQYEQKNHHISSAGINAMVGHQPDEMARQLMLEKGIDISNYQAKQITPALIRESDLILVMEQGHREFLERKNPSAKGKVFRLGGWSNIDIEDPYKLKREAFEKALQLIEISVREWVKRI